jgi:energy-coupling factor transport system ATP-binding protein
MIQVRGLVARAGTFEILKGIDLDIGPGEFVALVGPNGAGKTTLIKHFNGLRVPSAGSVVVDGMDTRRVKTSRLARSVGFLFQNPDHQIISNRVDDEIAFGLRQTGIPEAERGERVREAAATLGLAELLEADPFTLSRAFRQRVALASVLALRPKVLVLDEPTSSQDERGSTMIMEVARELNDGGTTVILVSHDMELVARCARRALVLVDGRLVAGRSVHALFRDKQLLNAAGLSVPGAYRLAAALDIEPESGRQFVAATVVEAVRRRLPGARPCA